MINLLQNKAQNKIDQALISLLENAPISSIKVGDLCKKAGISKTTFYTYYESIDMVLRTLEERLMQTLIDIHKDFPYIDFSLYKKDEAINIYEQSYKFAYDNRPYFRAIFGTYGDASFKETFMRNIKLKYKKKFEIMNIPDTEADFLSSYIGGATVESINTLIYCTVPLNIHKISIYHSNIIRAMIELTENIRLEAN